MNEVMLIIARMFRHPILTIKTLVHMLTFRKLLKQEGYTSPLRKDIWYIDYHAGFMIATMRDETRVVYNTRVKAILA